MVCHVSVLHIGYTETKFISFYMWCWNVPIGEGRLSRRRQLSALQMMEMPLDGAKYGWLLNLQTLDYPKKLLLAPQINFTFLHYISTEPILKQLQSEASLTAADLCSKFNFVIWGSRAKFKKEPKCATVKVMPLSEVALASPLTGKQTLGCWHISSKVNQMIKTGVT